jgi:hypothetical protein
MATPLSPLRVLIKTLLLFIALNGLYTLAQPLPIIGRISIYNTLVNGRERLPYGVNGADYNLSPNSLEVLFATHQIAAAKPTTEYRVLLLGDSSVWGFLLKPEATLASYLNQANLTSADGRTLRFYNIGYPEQSLLKDGLLFAYAQQFAPDALIWLVTLESFYRPAQLEPAIVQHNAARVRDWITMYALQLNPQDSRLLERDAFGQTLIGQRRELADWLRLQSYGVAWWSTGIDQIYPAYTPRSNDFAADEAWYTFTPSMPFTRDDLAFDVLAAGIQQAQGLPVLIVNEPIFIADGRNSDLRYNFWYPRWAYDRYREFLGATAENATWRYLDLWDSLAPSEFTDSPVHLTPLGSQQLSALIAAALPSGD